MNRPNIFIYVAMTLAIIPPQYLPETMKDIPAIGYAVAMPLLVLVVLLMALAHHPLFKAELNLKPTSPGTQVVRVSALVALAGASFFTPNAAHLLLLYGAALILKPTSKE